MPRSKTDETAPADERARARSLISSGRTAEARDLYLRLLQRDDRDVETLTNLGIIEGMRGDLASAVAHLRRAAEIAPNSPDVHFNLGNAVKLRGNLADAVACYRRAAALRPEARILNNLANTLKSLGQVGDAIGVYERLMRLAPEDATAHYNFGSALREAGELDRAIEVYRKAIALRPEFALAWNNLGIVFLDQSRFDEAADCYRTAVQLDPNNYLAHSNLLRCFHYRSVDSAEILGAYREWEARHAPAELRVTRYDNDPDPERVLRIGYVSPDLHTHSVAYFFEPLLARHDRSRLESYCYSDVLCPDATTKRLESLATAWRTVRELSDDQVFEYIRRDRIDILVDLTGHAGHHRLRVFGRRPAPVQVSYLGYPGTTGLSAIDYRITDAWADPPGGSEAFHSETLVHLPHGFLCYRPPADAPAVDPLPAAGAGHVTFGSFNNAAKINPQLISWWAEILRAVPRSRLLLKNKVLRDVGVGGRIRGVFCDAGIAPDRVELLAHADTTRAHLDTYNRIDVALDTYPYCGTTTTCEAMWMGVPVITLVGDTHISRVGFSLLSQVGLTELAATRPQEYVQAAVALAGDQTRVVGLRAGMRARLRQSPLCDEHRHAAEIESVYRDIWRRWCLRLGG
jgi:predicted O-linked N-acetylglucosamine transferase (SPINDLY family)